MKKIIKILLPFLVVSSSFLTSCKKDKKEEEKKTQLSFGDVHSTKVKEISLTDLNDLVLNKDNFIMVVSSTTCSCWNTFEPIINDYIKNNQLICYHLTFDLVKEVGYVYGLNKLSSSTTTFAVFKNGSLAVSIDSNSNTKIMSDSAKFAQFMAENVINPKCFFINENDYQDMKTQGKNAVVYFERNGCGDCKAANPTILRSYIESHKDMKKIYVLDCQEFYAVSGTPGYENYLQKKHDLGLSTVNNPTYGYGNGVFPYFSYIENGTYASGAAIYNDTVSLVNNKYVITDSYYTEERKNILQYNAPVIKGKELADSDLNKITENGEIKYVTWDYESANKYYKDILTSFLDWSLSKTNVNL